MKKYTCPICGETYQCDVAPEKCKCCACPSNKFTCEEMKTDEESARAGADIFFGVYIVLSLVSIIYAIVVLSDYPSEAGEYFGYSLIIVGLIFFSLGWKTRTSIRLFANMSERLTSIDKKLK